MTYLYITKIEEKYYIMDLAKSYDYLSEDTGYLVCKIDDSYSVVGVEISKAFDMSLIIEGCKEFKENEIEARVAKILAEYTAQFSESDMITWQTQEREAEKYNDKNGKYSSDILTSIASSKNIEINSLVSKIIEKANKHKTTLLNFKILRDSLIQKLEELKTVEDFHEFNVVTELSNVQQKIDLTNTSVQTKKTTSPKIQLSTGERNNLSDSKAK